MRKNKSKWFLLTPVIIALVTFSFYHFFYAYHLFFKEQIQLFLCTSDYLLSYFDKPANLARLSGDFFTQFFYLRGGGPLVLALIFSIEWLLLRTIIRKEFSAEKSGWWAIIPLAIDFTLHLNLQYTTANSMGLVLVLVVLLFLQTIGSKFLRSILALAFAVTGHYLFGNAIFILPFFVLFSKQKYHPILGFTILVLVLANPLLTRGPYLLTLEQAYTFPLAFPWGLKLPLSVVLVFLLSLFFTQKKASYFVLPITSVLLLLSFLGGIHMHANFNREKILTLDSETYFGNVDKVIEFSEKNRIENRFASYYTNMILAQKGELSERLLEFYQPGIHGLLLPVSQYESWQSILFSNELFYLMGDMNFAQHSAMLGNTFSPNNRSSRMIKRLAEINMVTQDFEGAAKYLTMLEKTLFHKKWAQSRWMENNAHSKKIWLAKKRQQLAKEDIIRTAFDYVNSIDFLVQQNPNNQIALDFLLCYHLLNKDLKSFKIAYDTYVLAKEKAPAKVYAEALLILLFRDNASEQEFEKYGITPERLNRFISYTELFEKSKGELEELQAWFGKTYWFYYHFATMKEDADE